LRIKMSVAGHLVGGGVNALGTMCGLSYLDVRTNPFDCVTDTAIAALTSCGATVKSSCP
jgi:hypothetical protein